VLWFAAAVSVFHHLPTLLGDTVGSWVDLLTPFAVVPAAALALVAIGPRPLPLAVALVAALLYVDGHGIHLAANDIAHEPLGGSARDVTDFWDERLGHAEWHLGWFGLVLAVCLAERGRRGQVRVGGRGEAAATALLLGFTLFTNTVEGQTWPATLLVGIGFAAWALAARRPLLTRSAAAFGVAAALIGGWAVWQGGVPEFTEVWPE
jgi:hypothetical protein